MYLIILMISTTSSENCLACQLCDQRIVNAYKIKLDPFSCIS